jgi:hypothetical protein
MHDAKRKTEKKKLGTERRRNSIKTSPVYNYLTQEKSWK